MLINSSAWVRVVVPAGTYDNTLNTPQTAPVGGHLP